MSEKEWQHWIRSKVQRAAPILWVLKRRLACSPRPLRYHTNFGGRLRLLPLAAASALSKWLDAVCEEGIGTITCLATPAELQRYTSVAAHDADLIALYHSRGFVVHHHPIEDPAHTPFETRTGVLQQLERLKPVVLDEYHRRSGPLLVHCSGGMDRAAPIAAFIAARDIDGQPDGETHD